MNTSTQTIEIQELNPDMIPPITGRFQDPNYNGGCKLVVVGKPGCFAPGTLVLMADGTQRPVESVKLGEEVMGDDSTPRTVLELCWNREEMYTIRPKSGESYTVNAGHKLVLTNKDPSQGVKYDRSHPLEITVQDFLSRSETWQSKWNLFRAQVQFPEQSTSFCPYRTGLTLARKDTLPQIVQTQPEHKIPLEFKVNTREIRLKLLSGFLDFSGTLTTQGYEWSHSDHDLVQEVAFVARTLGFIASVTPIVHWKIHEGQRVETVTYRLHLSGPLKDIPCFTQKTPRADEIPHDSSLLQSDFKVIPQGEGEYYGFVLDGNHRFLLGSCDVVRNTGKSTLIKSLLYAKKHIFPVGIAMSGSEDTNHAYKEIMPSAFVFNSYNEQKITDVIKRQKLARKHLPNPWAVMILDDCTDDPRIFNTPLQQAIFKKSRHWATLYILSLQYAMDVRPVIRTNVDGIFILREPLLKNREALYKNYASIIPDFQTFCMLMDQLTQDYTALYIHGATQTNRWQDCVFYWRAPGVPKDWKFGCPEYWDFHNARYNPDFIEDLTGF
jgi:hypothetical protein